MIIKEIELNNFLSYYGTKSFCFKKGLNLIIGNNGAGKTSFYEGIEWLFDGHGQSEIYANKKALNELSEGDSCTIGITLIVEQYNQEKTLKRSFEATMTNRGYSYSQKSFIGHETNASGERSRVDATRLASQIFDPRIRKYSMFKGEQELNILKNTDSLNILVNYFSDTKHYDKYLDAISVIVKKADKAVSDEAKKNKKNTVELHRLEREISKAKDERRKFNQLIEVKQSNVDRLEKGISEAEKYVGNAESLEIINNRIDKLESKIKSKESLVSDKEKYTTSLFDENWIAIHFEQYHSEYMSKINALSLEKRALQKEHDRAIGAKEGVKKIKKELLGFVPLPIGTPSKAHMEEMLNDEVCKVCNTPAPKGSDAYKYMATRLDEFLKSQEPEIEEETEELFKNDFLSKMISIGDQYENDLAKIRNIENDITDTFDFVQSRSEEIEAARDKLDNELEDRAKIIGGSAVGEETLNDVLKNYNQYQKDLANDRKDLSEYIEDRDNAENDITKLTTEKESIEEKSSNQFLLDTKMTVNDISKIFNDSRDEVYNEFIDQLEEHANILLKQTNKGSFTGRIYFRKTIIGENRSISVKLLDANDEPIKMNKAQENMMNISVLLSISSMVKSKNEQSYPILMDAPTSDFDEQKKYNFYEAMMEKVNQTIIVTKDFFNRDETINEEELNQINTSTTYWIKLADSYQNEITETIDTLVEKL